MQIHLQQCYFRSANESNGWYTNFHFVIKYLLFFKLKFWKNRAADKFKFSFDINDSTSITRWCKTIADASEQFATSCWLRQIRQKIKLIKCSFKKRGILLFKKITIVCYPKNWKINLKCQIKNAKAKIKNSFLHIIILSDATLKIRLDGTMDLLIDKKQIN